MNNILKLGISTVLLVGSMAMPTEAAVNVSPQSEQSVVSQSIPQPIETVKTVPTYNIVINEAEAIALAKMAWGEARGVGDTGIAATMWCVLNRVDSTGYGFGKSIIHVITFPYQFLGYRASNPVDDHIYNIAVDVLTRWQMEKQGASPEEVGRVLPKKYKWFYGDGKVNHFKDAYRNANIWDWSLPSPYEVNNE